MSLSGLAAPIGRRPRPSAALPPRAALLGLAVALGVAAPARAEPLPGNDLGVLANDDVKVVQEDLYGKAGHVEIGAALGLIPNDPYVLAGTVGLRGAYHLSDVLAIEVEIHGASARSTQAADALAELGGVAVDSYSPRAAVAVDALVTPVYAKLNLAGLGVVHYDVYLAAGVGALLARRTILSGVDAGEDDPSGGVWNSPASVNLGLGHRFFFRPGDRTQSIRLDLRDHLYLAEDPAGGRWPKNNLHLTAGWAIHF